MFLLESERLLLLPLNYEQLQLSAQDFQLLEHYLELNPSELQIEDAFAREMKDAMYTSWLPNTRLYPELYQWYTNWQIVLKSSNTIIGSIGFSNYPDDYGETSVGYVISKSYQESGYASEALRTLLKWGFSFNVLKAVKADTTPDNKASQKVLTKVGFKPAGIEEKTLYYRLNKKELE